MCASIKFVICVSNSKKVDRFQDLLAGMMKTSTDAVSSTKEEPFSKKEIPLIHLIKLAKHNPRFLRMQIVDVVFTVLDIVEADCVEGEVRHVGVEFLLTLVEAKAKAPGMMKKLPLFIGRCFAMLLNLIKDDPAWQSAENSHDQSGTTRTFHVGRNALMRFSSALGNKSVAHEAKEQLSAYLVSPKWEKRHAALVTLADIARSCSEVITKNLRMVLKCFQDPHPRVRWAA